MIKQLSPSSTPCCGLPLCQKWLLHKHCALCARSDWSYFVPMPIVFPAIISSFFRNKSTSELQKWKMKTRNPASCSLKNPQQHWASSSRAGGAQLAYLTAAICFNARHVSFVHVQWASSRMDMKSNRELYDLMVTLSAMLWAELWCLCCQLWSGALFSHQSILAEFTVCCLRYWPVLYSPEYSLTIPLLLWWVFFSAAAVLTALEHCFWTQTYTSY